MEYIWLGRLPVLHGVVGKTGRSHPVVCVEGRGWEVAAVSLTEVSRHEQNVPTKLDKILVAAPQLHLLQTEISNKEISVCGWVWLIRLLWRVLISHYWTVFVRNLSSMKTDSPYCEEGTENSATKQQSASTPSPCLSYRDGSGDSAREMPRSWRKWCSLEILVLASVYSSFPSTVPPAYNRDVEKSSFTLQSTDLFNFQIWLRTSNWYNITFIEISSQYWRGRSQTWDWWWQNS